MKKTSTIIIAIVVVLAIWVFSSYNSLVSTRETYTAQWSQVQNQYQRRFDLIPNLVASVQGSLKQEQAVFTAIAEARTRYAGATTQAGQVAAANQVESALGRLLVIVESYPELKSTDLVKDLLVQLEGTENRVATERQKYNETVRSYNLKVQRIPGSILASLFNFDVQPYFESIEGSDTVPKVQF